MHAPIVFRSKTFRYPFWPSLILLSNLSLGVVMSSVMMGLHPFLSTLLMFGLVMLGIGVIGAHATYTLEAEGIRQHLEPFRWSLVKLPPVTRQFLRQDIKSYKVGSDMSRSMEPYNYLYISIHRFPWQLRLSDHQSSKEQLAAFTEAFENWLQGIDLPYSAADYFVQPGDNEKYNRNMSVGDKAYPVANEAPARRSILRKPDFYHTRIAHVIFWLLVVVLAVLVLAMLNTGTLKTSYLWRFNFIILPGMGYYAWRLYGQGRQS